MATTFGNGLVNANLGSIAGNAGLYAYEASLLLALYVAFNASANLLLVRGRTQFGVPLITQGLLALYAFAALVAMLVPGVATAAIVRCACGMASAALITFSIYCWMQALPAKVRPIALVLGISLPQVGMPLARMIPVEELGLSGWRGLAGIECALALLLLAASNALPMPPSERKRVLCKRDVLTYALALSGYLLLCLVLATGRLLWWTDTPWLGVALAISVPLLCAALVIELRRRDPLVKFDWLTTGTMVRFAIVALVLRLALAEQTYGAVGLLSAGGLTNDQLHLLFGIVSVAMLAGILITVLTLKPARLPWQVVGAAVLIAAGALLDSYATSVTRPPQLYLSQALLGIGTTLFIGPALLFGFLQVLQKGVDYLVSFVVMFSTTQNIGGLAGAAWLGTYQTMATRRHAASLSEHVLAQDPQVLSRLQSQGVAQFSASLQREAAVLGFNDSFVLVATVALLAGALLALQLLWPRVATLWRGVRA
ncbi:MAG: MFS transporter [Pseudomonadota bacterium]